MPIGRITHIGLPDLEFDIPGMELWNPTELPSHGSMTVSYAPSSYRIFTQWPAELVGDASLWRRHPTRRRNQQFVSGETLEGTFYHLLDFANEPGLETEGERAGLPMRMPGTLEDHKRWVPPDLENAKSSGGPNLFAAMADAIKGLDSLYTRTGMVHGDVSPVNIAWRTDAKGNYLDALLRDVEEYPWIVKGDARRSKNEGTSSGGARGATECVYDSSFSSTLVWHQNHSMQGTY